NFGLILLSGTQITNLIGGAGNDVLSGSAINNTLTGGGGLDTYLFDTTTPQGSDTIVESSGIAQVSFAPSSLGCTFDASSTQAQTVNANLTLTLSSATGILNLLGGNGNDALTGNALDNALTGGQGNDTLAGGAGNDTFFFNASAALGTDAVSD